MAELSSTSLFSDANLVSYYKLEDTSDSKGSNTLTNNGSGTFAAAKYSNGYEQGTSNSTKYLTINTPIIDPAGDWSISCWVKVNTAPTSGQNHRIINVEKNQATGYIILWYQNVAGTLRLHLNASNGAVTYNVDLGTSSLHHIVANCSSGNLTIYLNGVSVATGTRSTDSTTQNRSAVGAKNDGTDVCSMLIDDVGFFSRSLTISEVQLLTDANPYSLDFNGSSQYARKASPTGVFGQANMTLECWIKVGSFPGASVTHIFSLGTVAGTEEICGYLRVTSGSKLVGAFASGASAGQVTSTTSLSTGTWYHAAVTYDGSNVRLYLGTVGSSDAEEGTAASLTGTLNTPSASHDSMYLGAVGITNETDIGVYFDGQVDEARIWSSARTLTELNTYRKQKLAGTETGLIGLFNLNDGAGSTADDVDANNNDLTLTGSPSWLTDVPFSPYESGAVATTGKNLLLMGVG